MPALHRLPAPAKINLFLHVVGRRADGYHLLQSVFALVDWCDTIDLHPRSDGAIQRHDGTLLQVSQLVSAQTDTQGRIEFISLILRDVSERKRIEQTQREWAARQELGTVVEGRDIGSVITKLT